MRDAAAIRDAASEADVIVHLAGQVAVTTSVTDPRDDFECNALGTFNTLEGRELRDETPSSFIHLPIRCTAAWSKWG